jgi:Luciferase-like monooxygenase
MWTKKAAEFHGQYYNFLPVRSYPKLAPKPHPPVILGGFAKNVLQRVVSWADGWLPNRITPAEVETSRGTLDTLARPAGRAPADLTISVYGQAPERALCQRFHDVGATRVIIRPPTASTEQEMAEELERIAEAVIR